MMFDDFLSNRWIQGGIVFFVLCVGGSLLYSVHVRHTTVAELAQSDLLLQQRETQDKTRATADAVDTSRVNFEQAEIPLENQYAPPIVDDTVALPSDDAALIDLSETFEREGFVSAEPPAGEGPVSPYGFGPYPEVPPDFPFKVDWTETSAEMELLGRVMIKAWGEGERFVGANIDFNTNKVYLNYPRTVYVHETDTIGSDGSVIGTNRLIKGTGDVAIPGPGEPFPPDVRVLDYDSEGIDPYTYLNLP